MFSNTSVVVCFIPKFTNSLTIPASYILFFMFPTNNQEVTNLVNKRNTNVLIMINITMILPLKSKALRHKTDDR